MHPLWRFVLCPSNPPFCLFLTRYPSLSLVCGTNAIFFRLCGFQTLESYMSRVPVVSILNSREIFPLEGPIYALGFNMSVAILTHDVIPPTTQLRSLLRMAIMRLTNATLPDPRTLDHVYFCLFRALFEPTEEIINLIEARFATLELQKSAFRPAPSSPFPTGPMFRSVGTEPFWIGGVHVRYGGRWGDLPRADDGDVAWTIESVSSNLSMRICRV